MIPYHTKFYRTMFFIWQKYFLNFSVWLLLLPIKIDNFVV